MNPCFAIHGPSWAKKRRTKNPKDRVRIQALADENIHSVGKLRNLLENRVEPLSVH